MTLPDGRAMRKQVNCQQFQFKITEDFCDDKEMVGGAAGLRACTFLVFPCGCKGGESAVAQNYRRMKRMNLKWGDEYVTLDCDWGDDGCNLTIVEEGEEGECRFAFDRQTGKLSSSGEYLHADTLLKYDGQKVVHMAYCWGTYSDKNGFDVVYEDNKITIQNASPDKDKDDNVVYEYDPDAKTFTQFISERENNGVVSRTYEYSTVDDHGNVLKQDRSVFEDADGNGEFEKVSEGEYQTIFDRDEDGNLIKIYFPGDDSVVYTFEYYDDTVKQPWERTLPYLFLDDGVGFNLVTFWGLFE